MHGNLNEWCRDWFDREFYARAPELDPCRRGGGNMKVVRGGDFSYPSSWSRSAHRLWKQPHSSSNQIGVRPSREVDR